MGTKFHQLDNFGIEVDQSRYCLVIIKKYVDIAGCKKNIRWHEKPFAIDFVPSSDDCSATEEDTRKLEIEYNIDFTSCVGSLIYLVMTRADIIYAVNILAKYTQKPGKVHFDALIHLLRYLHDNAFYGLCYYSNIEDAPLTRMLMD